MINVDSCFENYYILSDGGTIERVSVKKDNEDTFKRFDSENPEYRSLLEFNYQHKLRLHVRDILRKTNCNVSKHRPDEKYFSKLDSSLKRNTAFVRKVRAFSGSQLDILIRDIKSLNLTKYLSEIAAGLVEANLKMCDVWPATNLCSILHELYTDFASSLLENWNKALDTSKIDKVTNISKIRVDLRFFTELVSFGIFSVKTGFPVIENILTSLIQTDKDEQNGINVIISFCRYSGEEYMGIIPRKIKTLLGKYSMEVTRSTFISKEKQRRLRSSLHEYYNCTKKRLERERETVESFIRQNKMIVETQGELSGDRVVRLDSLQSAVDRLDKAVKQLAELLDQDQPSVPDDLPATDELMHPGVECSCAWDGEESRRFYEQLPDVREYMTPAPQPDHDEEAEDAEQTSSRTRLDAFLSALPTCITSAFIDSAAIEFVNNYNNKPSRKKLIRALYNVPRLRLDLLPLYARFVAILHPVLPAIGIELCQQLKQQFQYLVKKNDQINRESKIKVVRFIGELIKFNLFPKNDGLQCFQILVSNFNHHHIEMCCSFLECCGRYLAHNPACYPRVKIYLEQMMRKKTVIPLDHRYVTMIENAYFHVNPPEKSKSKIKEMAPELLFLRHVLYQNMKKTTMDQIVNVIRKLDWDQPNVCAYAIKHLTNAYKIKYFDIRSLACIVAGVSERQEFVGVQVVDGVLEDIRLGMEMNLPKFNQRRVAMVRYLGELYNYKLLKSETIFQTLYSLINFGVTWDHNIQSLLDPPASLFRIRLVCVLLDTCGQYFISHQSTNMLDTFLSYFQYYFWFKHSDPHWTIDNPFPVNIKSMFRETIINIDKATRLFDSIDDAKAAIALIQVDDLHESDSEFSSEDDTSDISEDSPYASKQVAEYEASEAGNGAGDGSNKLKQMNREHNSAYQSNTSESETASTIDEETLENDCFQLAPFQSSSHIPNFTLTNNNNIFRETCCINAYIVQVDGIDARKSENNTQGKCVCKEDEEFIQEFERLVSEMLRTRAQEVVKVQLLDISIPLHIRNSAKFARDRAEIDFLLVVHRGHKPLFKKLTVPLDSEIGRCLQSRASEEREELASVKRLTLDMTKRLDDASDQETPAKQHRKTRQDRRRPPGPRRKYRHVRYEDMQRFVRR